MKTGCVLSHSPLVLRCSRLQLLPHVKKKEQQKQRKQITICLGALCITCIYRSIVPFIVFIRCIKNAPYSCVLRIILFYCLGFYKK